MRVLVLAMAALLTAQVADAAEPASLTRARTLYNAADYDGAIAAAALARTQTPATDAAALVEARARLERYRRNADSEDLMAARDALNTIRASVLVGRDQVDFLVGLGQSLYLTDFFGAAALDFLAAFLAFFADFLADFFEVFFAAFFEAFFEALLADFFFEDFLADFFAAIRSFFFLLLLFLFFFPLAIVTLLLPPIKV